MAIPILMILMTDINTYIIIINILTMIFPNPSLFIFSPENHNRLRSRLGGERPREAAWRRKKGP